MYVCPCGRVSGAGFSWTLRRARGRYWGVEGVKGDGWESEAVGGWWLQMGLGDDEEKGRRENVQRTRGWELRRRRCANRGGCGFRVL